MKYLLLFFLCAQALAAMKMENGEVQPFINAKYPLKEFIRDYAQMMKINVTYPSDMIKDKEMLHIELNSKATRDEFKKVFYELLANAGFTPIEDNRVLWINETRDIRYLPTKVYDDPSFPKDASYSTVIYRLKYPLSSEICRNMRPFLSRYGRVIDLSDARTLILNDRGDNLERLITTIKSLDIEVAYQNLINFKPEIKEDDENPLKEKVLELELDKKLLEKKYLDIKGAQQ